MTEFEGKKLLILGGVAVECDIVKYAKKMGIYTIVADYLEDSPAKLIADKAVLIDALDIDALVHFCRSEGVDGVITGFVDILLRPYMDVCDRLGLPCYITSKMLSMSTNKIIFKETCGKFGIPVPHTYLIDKELSEEKIKNITFPVFVKPLDASGSRGAGVCYNKKELFNRFQEALEYSVTKTAIIEEYIKGREFLLDYIAVDGEFRLLSIFDRYVANDRSSAINYSTISMAPSKMVDFYLENMNDKVIEMFKTEGFTDGVIFMQGYFNGNSINFFEMGCRLGGSYFNHERECLGYDALDMIIRYALTGKMVENINQIDKKSSKYKKYAIDCNYLLKGFDETIEKIIGLDFVESMPECIEVQKYHQEGYHYVKDRTVDKPVMVAEIVAKNRDEVIKLVNLINSNFDVLNSKGESLLMEKLNPLKLFDDFR